MPAPLVRLEFDNLAKIASSFERESSNIKQKLQQLAQQKESLQGGKWEGDGAKRFFAEMEDVVLPGMTRLTEALNSAGKVTKQIMRIMEEADDELARLFGGLIAVGAGAGGAAALGAARAVSSLSAQNVEGLFSESSLVGLIGLEVQGAGSELGAVMGSLLQNPEGDELDQFLDELAKLRGRNASDLRIEFEIFQEAAEQRDASGAPEPETPPAGGGGGQSVSMGSSQQMRFGKVVGDALGIDPAFGAMLNPGGGLMGPGGLALTDPNTAAGYHAAVHDAAGYLRTYHGVGPGYDYLGSGDGSPSQPGSGESQALEFWRAALGSAGGRRKR